MSERIMDDGVVVIAGRTFLTIRWLLLNEPDHPILNKTVRHPDGRRAARLDPDMLVAEVRP